MSSRKALLITTVCCLLVGYVLAEARKLREATENGENDIPNDIETRIQVGEPLKSLLQTGTRFMLAQTKVPSILNMDTAMNLINEIGYLLSKPSNLIMMVEAAALTVVSLLGATFIFPGFYGYLESVWRDPVNSLNLDKYLSNGISERSVMKAIDTTTNEAFNRVGLEDATCRERSICQIGWLMSCSFPETAQTVSKYATNIFSGSGYQENKYLMAFNSGAIERNCTKVALSSNKNENKNCLDSFIGTILSSGINNERSIKKYQSIQPVARS